MRFYVSRTSRGGPPCEGAELVEDDWVLDIEDLDALLALAERETSLVVSAKRGLRYPWVEIYDDYRE